jgi:hypothetical protein
VRLLRDGAFRAKMAGKARAAVELNYRWETQLTNLDHVVATVSPRPASSAPPNRL